MVKQGSMVSFVGSSPTHSLHLKDVMKEKLELTVLGYLFCLLNVYTTLNGYPSVGVAFGLVACAFFIKALSIRKK